MYTNSPNSPALSLFLHTHTIVPALLAHLKKVYLERCDKLCECYIAEPSEGSGVIDMKACLRRKQRKGETLDIVFVCICSPD